MSAAGPGFRQVVRAALIAVEPNRSMEAGISEHDADMLAAELAIALKAAGYSIHRSGECIHGVRRPEGREMTPAEQAVLLGAFAEVPE